MTPASSLCLQSWTPMPSWKQSVRDLSVPTQCTLSRWIAPIPVPNSELLPEVIPLENPNCLHTTLASMLSQALLQTVPHSPESLISTRPFEVFSKPLSMSRIFVSVSNIEKCLIIIIIIYVSSKLLN